MKKNFILITFLIVVGNVSSQELRVTWDNYTDGEVILGGGAGSSNENAIVLDITITNDGINTLQAGDTLLIAFRFDSFLLRLGDLAPGSVDEPEIFWARLIAPLAPGESINLSNALLNPFQPTIVPTIGSGISEGFQIRYCILANIQGTTVPFDTTFVNDLTPENNQSCVFYEYSTSVSITENLAEIVGEIYVSNRNLVINNNSFDFNSKATVNIINLTGQIAKTDELIVQRGSNTIGLTDLSEGIYIVSIQIEDKIITKKVVIQ